MKQDKIWEYFQTSAPGIFDQSRSRLRYLAGIFPPGAKVLNIGIGGGILEMEALRRGLDVHSLDPVEAAVQALAKRLGLEGRVKQGWSQDIPFADEMFDGVVISEVLEHLEDDVLEKTLKEVHRVLKPHGMVVGTVPAHEDMNQGAIVCPDCGCRFHRWGHVQAFDEHDLARRLGGVFRHVTVRERKFVGRTSSKLVDMAAETLRRVLHGLGKRMYGTNYVFTAHK